MSPPAESTFHRHTEIWNFAVPTLHGVLRPTCKNKDRKSIKQVLAIEEFEIMVFFLRNDMYFALNFKKNKSYTMHWAGQSVS